MTSLYFTWLNLTWPDLSYLTHSDNKSEEDRYVVIIDFWHPELSEDERTALDFVYDTRNKFETGKAVYLFCFVMFCFILFSLYRNVLFSFIYLDYFWSIIFVLLIGHCIDFLGDSFLSLNFVFIFFYCNYCFSLLSCLDDDF